MIQVFSTNLIDEAVSKVVSSEKTAYPASNAYNIDRRRLTWRSNGYWSVSAPANTIVFRESIGVDLTATIAVANYASDTTFLAAIKTALDAAGASTYTVSRDTSTGHIKIISDGLGGGGIFSLMWTSATGFGTIIGFNTAADDTGALTYTADLLRIHTEEHFIFDLGFPANPTGMIAVSDRNRPINISPTATITLEANPTNSFTAPVETFTITVRDYLLGYLNHEGIAQLAPSGYRYWKLKIIDKDNPDLYLELGAIFLGNHIEMERGCPAFPYEGQPIDNSSIEFSESGQTWVGKRPQSESHNLGWEKLTNNDFAALKNFWEDYGTHSSFFVCLDPDSVFSADGVFWTRIVKFGSPPSHSLVSPSNWSYQWNLREEL